MPREVIKIMVSSTVYGFEKDLRVLCATIESYKSPQYEYKVLNSHIGTVYVAPGVSNTEACLRAVNAQITSTVKSRLIEIVNYIALNPKTKVNDLVSHFSVSERTIKENLKVLIEANLVIYSGSKKAGFYILNKGLHDKLHE
jgi:predicted HTH transcriptional regulator